MKKEIFAAILLLAMFTAALINIRQLGRLTSEISGISERAANLAYEGKWDQAEKLAESALKKWEDSDTYTLMVLRHSEVETSSSFICAFIKEIYMRESGGVKGALRDVKSQMTSIFSIERIRLGSIF